MEPLGAERKLTYVIIFHSVVDWPWTTRNPVLLVVFTLEAKFACEQTSPISFVARAKVPFPRATKEIGDVYTQASLNKLRNISRQVNFKFFK